MVNKKQELIEAIDKLQESQVVKFNNRVVDLNMSLHRHELRLILKEDYNEWNDDAIDALFESLLVEKKKKVALVPGPPTKAGTKRYYWKTPKGTISLSTTGNAQKKGYVPASRDQAEKAAKNDTKPKKSPKVELGKEQPVEPQKDVEKNKTLKEDVDFSGEDTPKSITEDIQPDDDTINEKYESGELKRQEYEKDEIEINGKTYKQPLTAEDIESFFPNPPHKIPKKYIKALERVLATQYRGRGNEKMSDLVDGVGAGEFPAQAAELLTLMSTSMTDEQAAEFYDVIGQTVNNQTTKGAIDDKWVEACGASRKAIHRQIKEKYGEDAEVEFCGWDLQSDVEDGIGLGNYKEDKGFSTDAYFRVKTKDGPKVHEVSLKKDLETFWASLGAADIEGQIAEAGVESFEAEGDLTADQVRERDSVKTLGKNQAKKASKRFGEMTQEEVDTMVNRDEQEIVDNATKNLPSRPTDLKGQVLEGSDPNYKLSKKAKETLKFMKHMSKKYPLPWNDDVMNDPEFWKEAQAAGFGKNFKLDTANGRKRLGVMVGYLQYNEELQKGEKNGPAFNYLNESIGVQKPFPAGSAKDVQNKHMLSLAKPESREILMGLIRDKFPLKSLMEGEESMALSNQSLDEQTCMALFGTSDYDEINEGMTAVEDEDGNINLVYTAKTPGAKPVKIARIGCRQRGVGYNSPTTEILPHPELKHRLYCANKDKIKDEDYTKSERKTNKKAIKQYGDCKDPKY